MLILTLRRSTDIFTQTTYNAIKAGYRLFDGAGDYGNEQEAGQGVKRAIEEGLVKRQDLCECTSLDRHYLVSHAILS